MATFKLVFSHSALSPPAPDLLYLEVMPGCVQSPLELQDLLRHLVLCPPLLQLSPGPGPPGHGQPLGVGPHRLPHLVCLAPSDTRPCHIITCHTDQTLTPYLSGGSEALVGDLAGEEMMRESTEPEPEPAESK